MPHCMVQPSGEISVMIVPHCRVWEFHPPYWKSFSVIFFFVFVMQFGLWQSSFRIVSDTLVLHLYLHILTKNHPPIFYEIWHTTAPLELDWSLDQMWNLKKTKFKMVDGRHFKIVFGHNSAFGCEISLKFCVEKQLFSESREPADARVPQNVFLSDAAIKVVVVCCVAGFHGNRWEANNQRVTTTTTTTTTS